MGSAARCTVRPSTWTLVHVALQAQHLQQRAAEVVQVPVGLEGDRSRRRAGRAAAPRARAGCGRPRTRGTGCAGRSRCGRRRPARGPSAGPASAGSRAPRRGRRCACATTHRLGEALVGIAVGMPSSRARRRRAWGSRGAAARACRWRSPRRTSARPWPGSPRRRSRAAPPTRASAGPGPRARRAARHRASRARARRSAPSAAPWRPPARPRIARRASGRRRASPSGAGGWRRPAAAAWCSRLQQSKKSRSARSSMGFVSTYHSEPK